VLAILTGADHKRVGSGSRDDSRATNPTRPRVDVETRACKSAFPEALSLTLGDLWLSEAVMQWPSSDACVPAAHTMSTAFRIISGEPAC